MAKIETAVHVQHWSIDNLVTYGEHVIHELATRAAGTLTSYKLVLGRCLLAVDKTRLYQQFGCSGAIHYAMNVLGLGKKEAQTMRRVARDLEGLPKMKLEAELGTIAWSKFRAIVHKVTPETEDAWLELARQLSAHELGELATATEYGKFPWASPEGAKNHLTHFRLQLQEETHELFQRTAQDLSKALGRVVTVTEALERLAVEHLERKKPTDARVEKARAEARETRAAHQARRSRLVEEARTIVEESAKASEDALQQALGTDSVYLPPDSPAADVTDNMIGPSTLAKAETLAIPSSAERLSQWREMVKGSAEPCPGEAPLRAMDPQHWKDRRVRFNGKKRKLTKAQRREILRRDGHRCRVPGCPHHVWLDIHHNIPFSQQGPTLPWNLLALCTRCHANVHSGMLIIEGNEETGLRFLDRSRRPVDQPSPLEVAHWIDFWLGWSGGPYDCHKGRPWANAI